LGLVEIGVYAKVHKPLINGYYKGSNFRKIKNKIGGQEINGKQTRTP
jgi:hypothetical protein